MENIMLFNVLNNLLAYYDGMQDPKLGYTPETYIEHILRPSKPQGIHNKRPTNSQNRPTNP